MDGPADLTMPFLEILRQIQADTLYLESLDWGRPRRGHPEGSLRNHIQDLEANLERIQNHLLPGEYERLQLLIHVHDICKPDAWTGVDSDHPQNHAFLAREYLARFCDDRSLLAITQYHDDGYILYTYYRWADQLTARLCTLLKEVEDIELFVLFNLVDNCIPGKTTEPLDWFVERISRVAELSPRIQACMSMLRGEG